MAQDIRWSKNEAAIRSAIETLLLKTSIDHITVKNICETAKISRNTFYDHYLDKYDLVDKISEEFSEKIINRIICLTENSGYEASVALTANEIFDSLNAHKKWVKILSKNDSLFWEKLKQKLVAFTIENSTPENGIYAIFNCSAIVSCYKEFFNGKIKIPEKEFVSKIIEIATKSNDFMKTEKTEH